MNIEHKCQDTKDIVPLYRPNGLYLKPVALLHISVQLPQLKAHGKVLSNWEIMDKMKEWIRPEEFLSLKVSKSTLEFVRFDAEIESKNKLPCVISRLDGRSIKVSGFNEKLKVRAVESKGEFPSKHDWDSFFRDTKNMNEMRSGERPDTVYLSHLPCKWFSSGLGIDQPSERLIKNIFEQFGKVKKIDIPMLDPYRNQMNNSVSGVKLFTFNKNVIFEVYIQYEEYFCFVKCMDAFRGMKLVHLNESKTAYSASIKIDFDKSKHLSDASIRRRQIIRERLQKKEKERIEKEMKEKEEQNKRLEEERTQQMERRKQREEKRKQKQLEKLKLKEMSEMNKKIAAEEYLLLMAQRKLESIRLLSDLFNRIKNEKDKESTAKRKLGSQERDSKEKASVDGVVKKARRDCDAKDPEKDLRYKLIQKFKRMQQQELLRKEMASQNPKSSWEKQDKSDVQPISSDSECYVPGNRLRGRIIACNNNDNSRRWQLRRYQVATDNFNDKRRDRSYSANNLNRRGGIVENSRRRYRYPRGSFGGRSMYQNSWRQQQYAKQFMVPFVDPTIFLSYSQECFKYLKKMSRRSRRFERSLDRSNSQSTSRSYSSGNSRRSRLYSRSRSRSRSYIGTRSRSHSYSKSRTRTRTKSRTPNKQTNDCCNLVNKQTLVPCKIQKKAENILDDNNKRSIFGNVSDINGKSKDNKKKGEEKEKP